ncbi:MAG: hypothetical protein M0Q93_02190 [Terrimicrobiaceae bacterium]|nr:hypothetical protein [Terrimicrobiaceae bacterium]
MINDPFRQSADPTKYFVDTVESNSDRLVQFFDPHPNRTLPYHCHRPSDELLRIAHKLNGKVMPLKEGVGIFEKEAKKDYCNEAHQSIVSAVGRDREIILTTICGFSVDYHTLIKYHYLE